MTTPAYSSAFLAAVTMTLQHEGGFQCVRTDRGNWTSGQIGVGELRGTNRGISAMRYPTENIRGMTEARATELYHRDYWCVVRGDELPPAIAVGVFDFAVNSGPARAIPELQRVLGVAADGVLGPVTLAAAQRAQELPTAIRYARARSRYCRSLGGWDAWGKGWTARTFEVLALAAQLVRPVPVSPTP